MDTITPLERVIDAAGGRAKLAAKLGITSQAISQWDMVPWSRAPEVSQLTGIPLDEIRPDMFRRPETAA